MQDSGIPIKFAAPWAYAAGGAYIRAVPLASQIGIQNGAASLTTGFPPNCFTPIAGGGSWPFGQDFNGILNQITAWQQWQQAGGPIAYDATFQTAIGGYPLGAIVLSAVSAGLYWRSTTENNVTNPDTGGAGWVSAFAGRLLNVQRFTASGTYTPTAGMATVIFEVQGGGAAGCGCSGATGTNVSLGAPGTSGSYAKGLFTAAAVGASQTITVGAGGTGVGAGAGNPGGTSSGGALISAPGGVSGSPLVDQVPPTISGNGSQSSAPTGANIFGAIGTSPSPTIALGQFLAITGVGGGTIFGPGAPGISINTTGPAATNLGTGGGGSAVNGGGGSAAGGAGFHGIIIAWEYS